MKTWPEALETLDINAVKQCIILGVDINQPVLIRPQEVVTLPIVYCIEQAIGTIRETSKNAEAITLIKYLLAKKADIISLHPRSSPLLPQLIKKTYNPFPEQYLLFNELEEKETDSKRHVFELITLLLTHDPSWITHVWSKKSPNYWHDCHWEAGDTILHIAIRENHIYLAEHLIALDINTSLPNEAGDTPLHLIVSRHLSKRISDHQKKIGKCSYESAWKMLLKKIIAHTPKDENPLLKENKKGVSPLEFLMDPDLILQLLPSTTLNKRVTGYFFVLAIRFQHVPLLHALSKHNLPNTLIDHCDPKHPKTLNDLLYQYGSNEIAIDELIRRGADITELNKRENILFSPLVINIRTAKKRQALLTHLQKYDVDFHSSDNEGYTLLLREASWQYKSDNPTGMINYFLDKGLDIHTKTLKGNTILHELFATFKPTDANTITYLISRGANITAQNNDGKYPIELLVYSPELNNLSLEIMKLITMLVMELPAKHLPRNSWILFCIATYTSCVFLLDALFKRGFELTNHLKNKEIKDPNTYYDFWYHLPPKSLEWINKKYPDHKWLIQKEINETFFIKAMKHSFVKAKILLEMKASIKKLHHGDNLLNYFLRPEHPMGKDTVDFIRYLFSQGVDVDIMNEQGTSTRIQLKKTFLRHHQSEMLRAYIITQIAINAGWFFHFSYEELHGFMCTSYPHQKTDFFIKNSLKLSNTQWVVIIALEISIQHDDVALFERLLSIQPEITHIYVSEHRSNPPPIQRYSLMEYAIHIFVNFYNPQKDQTAIIKYLLETGRAKGCATFSYLTFIHFFLTHHRYTPLTQKLLENLPPETIDTKTSTGRKQHSDDAKTLLQTAVIQNNPSLIRKLVAFKANIFQKNTANSAGDLLTLACQNSCFLSAKTLLSLKASPNTTHTYRHFGVQTPLSTVIMHVTKKDIKERLVSLLLEHGANSTQNFFHFFFKEGSGFSEAIQQKYYESISFRQKREWGWLHLAVREGNLDLTLQLLADDSECVLLHEHTFSGLQVIHSATASGSKEVFKTLLDAKADANINDHEGRSVPRHAFLNGTLHSLGLSLECNINSKILDHFAKCLILNEEEFKNFSLFLPAHRLWHARNYAITLVTLFETPEAAKIFLDKHRDLKSCNPVHDLCQYQIPESDSWSKQAWAALVMEHGVRVFPYIAWAPRIEQELNRPPLTLADLATCPLSYKRQAENPELATLFIQHKIQEPAFDRALGMPWPKKKEYIPNLRINGRNIGLPHYYLKKLNKVDIRGFILGHLTHCCQSIGSAGETATTHGLLSPYGGFYGIFQISPKKREKLKNLLEILHKSSDFKFFLSKIPNSSQKKSYRKELLEYQQHHNNKSWIDYFRSKWNAQIEGNLVAQCWAWISDSGNLIFDSWEQLQRSELRDLCLPFLRAAAKQAISDHGYKCVLLGTGGQTPENLPLDKKHGDALSKPIDYYGYRDSKKEQYILAPQDVSFQTLEKPLYRAWAPDRMYDELLTQRDSNEAIFLFEPKKLSSLSGEDTQNIFLNNCIEVLRNRMDERESESQHGFVPCYSIVPKNRAVDQQEPYQRHWVGLAFSLFRIPTLNNSCISIYFLNAFRHLSLSLNRYVRYIEADYLNDINQTGPWLLESLKDFLTNNKWGSRLVPIKNPKH